MLLSIQPFSRLLGTLLSHAAVHTALQQTVSNPEVNWLHSVTIFLPLLMITANTGIRDNNVMASKCAISAITIMLSSPAHDADMMLTLLLVCIG